MHLSSLRNVHKLFVTEKTQLEGKLANTTQLSAELLRIFENSVSGNGSEQNQAVYQEYVLSLTKTLTLVNKLNAHMSSKGLDQIYRTLATESSVSTGGKLAIADNADVDQQKGGKLGEISKRFQSLTIEDAANAKVQQTGADVKARNLISTEMLGTNPFIVETGKNVPVISFDHVCGEPSGEDGNNIQQLLEAAPVNVDLIKKEHELDMHPIPSKSLESASTKNDSEDQKKTKREVDDGANLSQSSGQLWEIPISKNYGDYRVNIEATPTAAEVGASPIPPKSRNPFIGTETGRNIKEDSTQNIQRLDIGSMLLKSNIQLGEIEADKNKSREGVNFASMVKASEVGAHTIPPKSRNPFIGMESGPKINDLETDIEQNLPKANNQLGEIETGANNANTDRVNIEPIVSAVEVAGVNGVMFEVKITNEKSWNPFLEKEPDRTDAEKPKHPNRELDIGTSLLQPKNRVWRMAQITFPNDIHDGVNIEPNIPADKSSSSNAPGSIGGKLNIVSETPKNSPETNAATITMKSLHSKLPVYQPNSKAVPRAGSAENLKPISRLASNKNSFTPIIDLNFKAKCQLRCLKYQYSCVTKDYEEGAIITVTPTHITASGSFFAIVKDEELPFMLKSTHLPIESRLTTAPELYQIVLAKYIDGLWYRAQVLETHVMGNLVKIFYIDYGHDEFVHFRNLALCDKEVALLPSRSVLCRLADGQPVSSLSLSTPLVVEVISHKAELLVRVLNTLSK